MKRLLLVAICVCLLGCASFTGNAYRSLTVSYQTFDSSMTALGDLYREGVLSEEDKDKIVGYANEYRDAHNQAVTSLLTYETLKEPTQADKQATLESIAYASRILADFLAATRNMEGKR
jgi:hypothetical protein